jgi:hypothetical protein
MLSGAEFDEVFDESLSTRHRLKESQRCVGLQRFCECPRRTSRVSPNEPRSRVQLFRAQLDAAGKPASRGVD